VATPIVVRVEAPGWRRALPGAARALKIAARAALGAGGARSAALPAGELCLVLADDALLRRLNRKFRGRDKATNVLSFPGAPTALGDIVLALETVMAEAEAQHKTPAHHAAHLVVHGTLHLKGYDHETPGKARRMERLEREILAGLGIPDPYRAAADAGRGRR